MIDSHFHLEQKQYDGKRRELIQEWKNKLKAVITSCARPEDLDATLSYAARWKGFVYVTAGLHPQHAVNISEGALEAYLDKIRDNSEKIIGIGEIGLDYHWIKDKPNRERSKEIFRRLLEFAKELKKPVVIHNWDAGEDVINILEEVSLKKVQMHMFGEKKLIDRVLRNRWTISVGPAIFKSKERKKIVKRTPLEKIFLETDSPWFPLGSDKIGYPTNIRKVAEKIAEIKNINPEVVWEQCGRNVDMFYGLKLFKNRN